MTAPRRRRVAASALLVILAAVAIAPTASSAEPAACSGSRTPASFRACIAVAAQVYTRQWAPVLSARGGSVAVPTIDIFTGPPINPCVDATAGDVAVASFFCDKNRTVYVSAFASPYWTREYAREARRQGVLASDARRTGRTQARLLRGFANQGAATELAHELGHWVQEQAGIFGWYSRRAAGDGPRAGAYQSAAELSADCMAGWAQGRAAATGAWQNTPFVRWANHATIAELGGDLSELRPGFRFPREAVVIAHGGPWSRLQMYDKGFAFGVANADGLVACARAAASRTSTPLPPFLES
ncbi:MAG: neutral zinc metallopeptidase [Actinobacteria bacterium]|jgi:predicted metalloprotease|nr:neutral zinc metallopeptidase [Actinomycetota bacterium]